MERIRTLQINLIDDGSEISVSVFQGLNTEDGGECSRRLFGSYDPYTGACCEDCWIRDIITCVALELDEPTWTYFHTDSCTKDHEETPHA